MTNIQLDHAYRAFAERRPFRAFLIEFVSGSQFVVGHPEAVRKEGHFNVARRPDGGYVLFTAKSVSRLLDTPARGAGE